MGISSHQIKRMIALITTRLIGKRGNFLRVASDQVGAIETLSYLYSSIIDVPASQERQARISNPKTETIQKNSSGNEYLEKNPDLFIWLHEWMLPAAFVSFPMKDLSMHSLNRLLPWLTPLINIRETVLLGLFLHVQRVQRYNRYSCFLVLANVSREACRPLKRGCWR